MLCFLPLYLKKKKRTTGEDNSACFGTFLNLSPGHPAVLSNCTQNKHTAYQMMNLKNESLSLHNFCIISLCCNFSVPAEMKTEFVFLYKIN